ncbi:hypothetical protein FB451DRAFT_1186616 [Mycena latifolia]|nr:hypothetical protein FB451DRAFT_1186616 [Mycena latifolia]
MAHAISIAFLVKTTPLSPRAASKVALNSAVASWMVPVGEPATEGRRELRAGAYLQNQKIGFKVCANEKGLACMSSIATGCGPEERSAALTGCSALVGHTISGNPWDSDSDVELRCQRDEQSSVQKISHILPAPMGEEPPDGIVLENRALLDPKRADEPHAARVDASLGREASLPPSAKMKGKGFSRARSVSTRVSTRPGVASGNHNDLASQWRDLGSQGNHNASKGDVENRLGPIFGHRTIQELSDDVIGRRNRRSVGPTKLVRLHPDRKQLLRALLVELPTVWNFDWNEERVRTQSSVCLERLCGTAAGSIQISVGAMYPSTSLASF